MQKINPLKPKKTQKKAKAQQKTQTKQENPGSQGIKSYEIKPLIKVIPFDEIKSGDVLILPCEPGEEENVIRKMHPKLLPIMMETGARILAIGSDYQEFEIFQAIEVAKAYND